MKTHWVAPKGGATVEQLFRLFGEWPRHIEDDCSMKARTNLSIANNGVIEDLDRRRLHSENLEVEII